MPPTPRDRAGVIGSPGRTGALSVHFAAAELRCPHCLACIVSPKLVQVLERIRRHLGHALPVVSGYRCPIHNATIGGASDSQHMYGRAADLPLGLIRPAIAHHAGAIGIGTQDGWVRHVDVREGPPATWIYP